jgi:hypothetical protein
MAHRRIHWQCINWTLCCCSACSAQTASSWSPFQTVEEEGGRGEGPERGELQNRHATVCCCCCCCAAAQHTHSEWGHCMWRMRVPTGCEESALELLQQDGTGELLLTVGGCGKRQCGKAWEQALLEAGCQRCNNTRVSANQFNYTNLQSSLQQATSRLCRHWHALACTGWQPTT